MAPLVTPVIAKALSVSQLMLHSSCQYIYSPFIAPVTFLSVCPARIALSLSVSVEMSRVSVETSQQLDPRGSRPAVENETLARRFFGARHLICDDYATHSATDFSYLPTAARQFFLIGRSFEGGNTHSPIALCTDCLVLCCVCDKVPPCQSLL